MDRRSLIKGSLAAAAGSGLVAAQDASQAPTATRAGTPQDGRFHLKYAPHFGMFRQHAGKDLLDQLRFMHDEGFRALEDNGLPGRAVAEQERIGQRLSDLGMEMGVFVAYAEWRNPTFVLSNEEVTRTITEAMQRAVEVAARVQAKWCTVVPGPLDLKLHPDYQFANVVDNLRRCAEILEPAGLTAVLEPLNPHRDHPGLWLQRMPQAYAVCRAVDSPSVKILDDLYHQQITEGNLIPNLDASWSEIAYLQVGDTPGRKEPGTGEIHYRRVFGHIHAKGFDGIVGMEHGNSQPGKEGERAVIDAYVQADSF